MAFAKRLGSVRMHVCVWGGETAFDFNQTHIKCCILGLRLPTGEVSEGHECCMREAVMVSDPGASL